MISGIPMSKAELARQLDVSRTYVTLLAQGKRKPSKKIVDKLTQLKLTLNSSVNTCIFEHLTFNQGVTGSRPARPTKQNYSTPRNSNIFRVVRYALKTVISNPVSWAIEGLNL